MKLLMGVGSLKEKEVVPMNKKPIDKYVNAFVSKNVSSAKNVTYSLPVIVMVLVAAAWGGHSINSKALSPNADTIFYRIDTTVRRMENQLWRQSLQFLREKKKKLRKVKCYIIVDETHDSYTGRLLKKLKIAKKKLKSSLKLENKEKISQKNKVALKFIHKYKPKKGDAGSYKYLVFALVYGNKRRVLRVKAIKNKEKYKDFIIATLLELRKEVNYECVLFDRGFYDGLFIGNLKKNNIPFVVRARICKSMKTIYGFYRVWERYKDHEIGEHKVKGDLVLGVDYTSGKRTKWAFITNLEFENWYEVREIYRKRWNIENVFKATDGIQLRAQTNDPTTRLFCVCLSFLFYNAWQNKNKRKETTLMNFMMDILEKIFEFILRTLDRTIEFYRDKLKISLPFWNRIISSF